MNWILGLIAAGSIFPKIGEIVGGVLFRVFMIIVLGVVAYQYDKHITEYDVHESNIEFAITDHAIHGNTVTIKGYVRNNYESQLDRVIIEFVAEECEKNRCYTVSREEVTLLQPFRAGEKTGFERSFQMKYISDGKAKINYQVLKARADRGWL